MNRWVAVAAVALLAAGCTKSVKATSGGTPSSLPSAFPLTVEAATPVRIAARPTRIVSLSPTATEDLFAEGAGPQVVAVDDESNYPPSAPMTSLSGYTPNVEAIAGYRPDLVVISDDTNGLSASLGRIGIPTLLEPAASTLTDAYTEMEQIGQATGHLAAADALVQTTKSKIAALVASAPKESTPPTYYYELDQTLYTVTSKTFVGSLFGLVGMKSVADASDNPSDGGYPQLNAETLLAANPDYIFLADTICCQQSETTLAARPGYSTLTAVKDHRVIALNDDIASRWGPRVTVLLTDIVDALKGVSPSPAPS
ncbi:MAG TPA: helical backbone metal receptor [Actinomycetota bacterium]|nr:helical backbone metal receptor [Actinomycetota bacterium]